MFLSTKNNGNCNISTKIIRGCMEVKEKLNERVKTFTLLPGAQMSDLKINEKKVIEKIKSSVL